MKTVVTTHIRPTSAALASSCRTTLAICSGLCSLLTPQRRCITQRQLETMEPRVSVASAAQGLPTSTPIQAMKKTAAISSGTLRAALLSATCSISRCTAVSIAGLSLIGRQA